MDHQFDYFFFLTLMIYSKFCWGKTNEFPHLPGDEMPIHFLSIVEVLL